MFSIRANDVELRVYLRYVKGATSHKTLRFYAEHVVDRMNSLIETNELTWSDIIAINWTMVSTIPWRHRPGFIYNVIYGTIMTKLGKPL